MLRCRVEPTIDNKTTFPVRTTRPLITTGIVEMVVLNKKWCPVQNTISKLHSVNGCASLTCLQAQSPVTRDPTCQQSLRYVQTPKTMPHKWHVSDAWTHLSLLPHQMRLSCRKAGYFPQILLRQLNLSHGHDRHSENGYFLCKFDWHSKQDP